MYKLRHIYICDHCGAIALPETVCFMGDSFKDRPNGWERLGKEDLCPVCYKSYKHFKDSISRDCNDCKKYKTTNCPNSSLCYCTTDKPYFERRGTNHVGF